MFIDKVQVTVQGGNGGSGCDSFYQRTDRKSVPHGGDGGHGGSVIFRADTNAPDLGNFRFKQRLIAPSGGHGGSSKKRGRNGEDLIVRVPPGTRIVDRERHLLIRYLTQDGDEVVVAKGGEGGRGNLGGKEIEIGQKGALIDLELTLHLPADIFLIGLPNSGKSTLMNRLTRTHLKTEGYPFSTKNPEVGVWKVSDYESLKLCELPSLYEGSHEGRGLGSFFLKHLEDAPHILYLLDPASQFAASIEEGYAILRKELGVYSEDLLKVPHAVVVNKIDLLPVKSKAKKKLGSGVPVFYISALTGEGIDKLEMHLKKQVGQGQHA